MSEIVALAIIGTVILVHVLIGLAAHYLIPPILAETLPTEDDAHDDRRGGAV